MGPLCTMSTFTFHTYLSKNLKARLLLVNTFTLGYCHFCLRKGKVNLFMYLMFFNDPCGVFLCWDLQPAYSLNIKIFIFI